MPYVIPVLPVVPWQYVIPVAGALIAVSGVLATAWYRYAAKQLEVADRQAARREVREQAQQDHRQAYCHDALQMSDELLRSIGRINVDPGYVEHLEREVRGKAEGLGIFGTTPEHEAALRLANACAVRQQRLILAAANDLRDAARADLAPPIAGDEVSAWRRRAA